MTGEEELVRKVRDNLEPLFHHLTNLDSLYDEEKVAEALIEAIREVVKNVN